MKKPKPVLRIAINAPVRNPTYWHYPDSLCRTCAYLHLQEPFCETVLREGKCGTAKCSGYEKETWYDEKYSKVKE